MKTVTKTKNTEALKAREKARPLAKGVRRNEPATDAPPIEWPKDSPNNEGFQVGNDDATSEGSPRAR